MAGIEDLALRNYASSNLSEKRFSKFIGRLNNKYKSLILEKKFEDLEAMIEATGVQPNYSLIHEGALQYRKWDSRPKDGKIKYIGEISKLLKITKNQLSDDTQIELISGIIGAIFVKNYWKNTKAELSQYNEVLGKPPERVVQTVYGRLARGGHTEALKDYEKFTKIKALLSKEGVEEGCNDLLNGGLSEQCKELMKYYRGEIKLRENAVFNGQKKVLESSHYSVWMNDFKKIVEVSRGVNERAVLETYESLAKNGEFKRIKELETFSQIEPQEKVKKLSIKYIMKK